MVNINDLVDVVILQDDFFVGDYKARFSFFERDEGRAEELLGLLVTVAEGVPVIAHLHFAFALGQNLDIGEKMAGARFWRAGRAAFGFQAIDAIFKAATIGVIDQRDFALRIGGEFVIIGPCRNPIFDLIIIA